MSADYFYPKNLVWGNYDIDGSGHVDELGNPILLINVLSGVFPSGTPTVTHIAGGVNITFPSQLNPDDFSLLTATVWDYQAYVPSQIENIHHNWQNTYRDYKQARAALQSLYTNSGFANMNIIEKKIMSMWFTAPLNERLTVHTIDQQIEFGKNFHDNSIIARQSRANAATMGMYNYLTKMDAFLVIDDIVNNYDLIGKYITYGREGMIEDGLDGLFDYLQSRDNSIFSGAGFLNKDIYSPFGVPLAYISNVAMQIFVSGIY